MKANFLLTSLLNYNKNTPLLCLYRTYQIKISFRGKTKSRTSCDQDKADPRHFISTLRTQLSDHWRSHWPGLSALPRHEFPFPFSVFVNFVSVRYVDSTGSRFDGDLLCNPILLTILTLEPKYTDLLTTHWLMRPSVDSLGEGKTVETTHWFQSPLWWRNARTFIINAFF